MAFLMQNTVLVATFLLIALVFTPTSALVCNGAQNGNIGGVKGTLINDLTNDAVAQGNHVSKLTRSGGGITLHGLATCDNGSSASTCRNCLNSARGELNRCGNSVGGNAQIAGCTMRLCLLL